jgi:hypothetical protein
LSASPIPCFEKFEALTSLAECLADLVGVGNLEFSSAATDRTEVVFAGITEPEKLRQIVSNSL